jgi:signal transduction histidine kinase
MILAAATFITVRYYYNQEAGMRNVVMNRLIHDFESGELTTETLDQLDLYRKEYSLRAVPEKIQFIEMNDKLSKSALSSDEVMFDKEYIKPIRDDDGNITGFIRFMYLSEDANFTIGMAAIILLISYFAIMTLIFVGYQKLVKPFNNLSEYPERLAKGRFGDGIPEMKSKLFGKYIWGMNMLKDEIQHKDNQVNAMEREKQTLIISIAHGIKTPLSNIKLYAEAIERGIYHDDKKANPKDAETATKIKQNVDKVEILVKEIMDKSARVENSYSPEISSFYLEELAKLLNKEYSGRTDLMHIPFEIKCENNPIVSSDKDGIYTILAQLMENAIKYGSGQGIVVTMGRQDEDIYFSVKNKGNVLSEEEIAYVFKSFWRGSNSKNIEGQGIGLYVSKTMAECLGGDIFMKAWKDENTTEVTLIIPER